MKKKIILMLSFMAAVVVVLAFSVCAEEITVNTITSDTYGTIYQLSADPGLANAEQYKSTLNNIVDAGTDKDSLCIMTDGTYYYVFPTSYIIKEITGNQKGKFQYIVSDVNTALLEWDEADETVTLPQFTLTGSWGSTRINDLVAIEFSRDVLWFDRQHCLVRSTNLKEAVMHDDIYFNASLSTGIFSGCTALETVRLSTQCTAITGSLFNGCTSFTGISNWDEIKGNITSIGNEAFYNCSSIASLDLDDCKITSIGSSTFYGCSSLTSITLPNAVQTIDKSAFQGCSALTSLDVPDSLVTLGGKAFQGCSSLVRLEFPATVTGFGQDCFNGCSALEYINIPRDCTYIGNYTFSGCNKVNIDMSGANSLTSTGTNNSWGVTTSLVFPEGFLTCAGINSSYITELVFPNSTTSLGIIKCTALEEFVVPESVASLGDKAFDYCASLKKVTLPRGLTSIYTTGNTSFFGTTKTNLKTVVYTGNADDAILTDVLTVLTGATVTIENHCNVYYGGSHKASEEVLKTFLGQAFMSEYKIYTECGRECGSENVVETLGQLIHSRGYSNSEIPGSKAMMHSFVVDKGLVSKYQEHFADLKFGVLAVGENANAPFNGNLIDAQGNKAHEKIAMVDFTEKHYDELAIKIGGLDGYEDTNLYFCGFVIGGENVYYIENKTVSTQASTITYAQVSAILNPEEE